MPQYKLTYFDLAALVEPIRWVFKIAGVDFEDERIPREDWEEKYKLNGRFPMEQVPILEIDGEVYTQSGAILRYLAKKYGLVTGDELLDLKVDQADQLVIDGFNEYAKWVREKDPERQANQKAHMVKTALRLILTQLQGIVTASGGDFVAGSKLTYADLSIANWFNIWANHIDPEIPTKYPRLSEHNKAVLAVPQIKAWIEVRPKTPV
ncbi:unnamed protein product [Allacma fusca]|uniref:glutathione transferase n=1 Tax=Allacma fusca TaxID=39272 RepID=A0A8J2P9C5_9HEXA|nr:unnamed protein product [Allacma fusca]